MGTNKKFVFGGRQLVEIMNELERINSVIIINNLTLDQLSFLRKKCGLKVTKIGNGQLLELSKRKEVSEIDLNIL